MESKFKYQVLSPNSVAWFIQAALVADRSGNKHTRDLALSEAQRIAEERRLEQPAPDGSRVQCYDCRTTEQRLKDLERDLRISNGAVHNTFNVHEDRLNRAMERLAVQEDRLQTLSVTMRRIVAEIDRRLDALEAATLPAVANREWMDEVERQLARLGEEGNEADDAD